ncbi:MAG TPA: hypothetical protein VFX16_16105 [Pseudonocardiaceae bacterium]|nr:hypothetical protein [Pseudonocardiaceae bacterium]
MFNPYSAFETQVRYQHRQLIAEAERARRGRTARTRNGVRRPGRGQPAD